MRIGATLYVYKGEWGLPSIDFECLRAMCLVKFTRCPLHIEVNANPLRSGAGKLPYLQIGNEKFIGYRQIKKILDKEGYPVDVHLNTKEKQLSTTYTNWVFTNLHAYYNYFLYGEPNNYDTITRGLYAKRTPFPFNFYYPSTYLKDAFEVTLVMGGFDIHDKLDTHDSEYLVLTAKKTVNVLSKKLGRKVWFFGNYFSEVDAIIYAYLSIILKITLPNNPLQNHIKGCHNLINFISRITRDIFKNDCFSTIKPVAKSATSSEPNTTDINFLESERKTKIIAGIGAVAAMSLFAAWRGLYSKLTSNTKQLDYEGFDYDDEMEDNDDMR